MRKAGFARLLVLRAHVIPGVHGHNRGLVVLVHQHGQPVVKHKLRVLNVWNRNVNAGRCRCHFVGGRGLRLRHRRVSGQRSARQRHRKQTPMTTAFVCFSSLPPGIRIRPGKFRTTLYTRTSPSSRAPQRRSSLLRIAAASYQGGSHSHPRAPKVILKRLRPSSHYPYTWRTSVVVAMTHSSGSSA